MAKVAADATLSRIDGLAEQRMTELERANENLRRELNKRKGMEWELHTANDVLVRRAKDVETARTAALNMMQDMEEHAQELIASRAAALNMMQDVEEARREAEEAERSIRQANQQLRQSNQELEQAERRLKESEERYRLALKHAPVGIVNCDLDGRFLDFNEAFSAILGYGADELLGMSFQDVTHPGDVDRWKPVWVELLGGEGKKHEDEKRYVRKDGTVIMGVVRLGLIGESTGNPHQIVGIMEDVTQRRELEHRLFRAERLEVVGRLVGGVAHNFNNLMTIIMGHCVLLQRRLHADDPLRRNVEEMRRAGVGATSLTKQLLTFSRRQVLKAEVLNLNAIIEGVLPMVERLIGEDVEVLTMLDPDVASVKSDRGQVEQLVLNLATNARDAMPEGGKLTIETRNVDLDGILDHRHFQIPSGRYVLLAVSDNGCGMSAEIAARVFDPFFTTKEVGTGTGLGLATAYGTVKQSGGAILVDSERAHGTTFKIYLPRVEEDVAVVTDHPTAPPPLPPRGSETLLLVEDEDGVRSLTCDVLKDQGYTVLEAPNGMEALQICERHDGDIDLMLTDVVMPQMNGRALVERAASVRPGMKVIYMSGYTGEAIAHHGVLDVGVPFLQKPFSPDDLANMIRGVLNAPGVGKT